MVTKFCLGMVLVAKGQQSRSRDVHWCNFATKSGGDMFSSELRPSVGGRKAESGVQFLERGN